MLYSIMRVLPLGVGAAEGGTGGGTGECKDEVYCMGLTTNWGLRRCPNREANLGPMQGLDAMEISTLASSFCDSAADRGSFLGFSSSLLLPAARL